MMKCEINKCRRAMRFFVQLVAPGDGAGAPHKPLMVCDTHLKDLEALHAKYGGKVLIQAEVGRR